MATRAVVHLVSRHVPAVLAAPAPDPVDVPVAPAAVRGLGMAVPVAVAVRGNAADRMARVTARTRPCLAARRVTPRR